MSQQSPLPQNDPMLIAFQKLKHTPEYQNAVNWTIKAENESQADGELWFGFAAGWNAHAEHTAAIRREKAVALVAAADKFLVFREVSVSYGELVAKKKFTEELTALKAALEETKS